MQCTEAVSQWCWYEYIGNFRSNCHVSCIGQAAPSSWGDDDVHPINRGRQKSYLLLLMENFPQNLFVWGNYFHHWPERTPVRITCTRLSAAPLATNSTEAGFIFFISFSFSRNILHNKCMHRLFLTSSGWRWHVGCIVLKWSERTMNIVKGAEFVLLIRNWWVMWEPVLCFKSFKTQTPTSLGNKVLTAQTPAASDTKWKSIYSKQRSSWIFRTDWFTPVALPCSPPELSLWLASPLSQTRLGSCEVYWN